MLVAPKDWRNSHNPLANAQKEAGDQAFVVAKRSVGANVVDVVIADWRRRSALLAGRAQKPFATKRHGGPRFGRNG